MLVRDARAGVEVFLMICQSLMNMFFVGSTMSGLIYDLAPGSSGLVTPITQLRFIGDDDKVLDQGQEGEMEVRSIRPRRRSGMCGLRRVG